MSQPPEDQPTRRIPARPPAERPAERPVEPAGPTWHDEFADRLNSLRTAVVLLGVLSVAALGVAIFAALKEDKTGGNGGASNASVSALEERVDKLESSPSSTTSSGDVSALEDSIDSLESQVKSLESTTSQNVDSLQQDVADLKEQVDSLEQQQGP